MNFPVQVINQTTPAISVQVADSGVPAVTYEQIKQSLGRQVYEVTNLYIYSENINQLLGVIQYQIFDSNGNQNYSSIATTIDPYEGNSVAIDIDLRDYLQDFILNGNSSFSTTILPNTYVQVKWYANRITNALGGGGLENFRQIEIDAHKPDFFNNYGSPISEIQETGLEMQGDLSVPISELKPLHDESQIKDIKSFSSSFSIPFKYNTFSYDFSRSEFKGQNPGQNASSTLTGFSQSNKFTLDRVLLNQTNLRLSTNASLTDKSSASYLSGDKISTSERKLSILNVGFAASSYINNTTNIYFNPSYSKGLKIMNAKKDLSNISNITPKAQFDVFKLYANFSKKFTLPKINAPTTFVSEFSSQYAKQTLFGSEQFSVGGYYSVRGFRESYINGDSGYYLRNKINFNIGSLITPEGLGFFSKNLVPLNKFSVEPFYDYGYVKNKYIDSGADGRLAGAGLKTIFNSKYFNASLTYSWATNHSRLVTSNTKENKLVYFEISASCC